MSTLDFDIEDVDMTVEGEDELDQWHSLLDAPEALDSGDLPPEHDEAFQSLVNVSEMDVPKHLGAAAAQVSVRRSPHCTVGIQVAVTVPVALRALENSALLPMTELEPDETITTSVPSTPRASDANPSMTPKRKLSDKRPAHDLYRPAPDTPTPWCHED